MRLSKMKMDPKEEYPGYSIKNNLGKGAYGEVRSARHEASGKMVAIKKMENLFANKFSALRALREVTLLRVIDHPNIIKIYQIIPPTNQKDFNTLSVVLEFLPMDLRKLCTQNLALIDQNIQKIVYQILLALKYLRDSKILHRDLKPQNILVDTVTYDVKLCDFGLARSVTVMQAPKNIKKQVLQKLNEEVEHQKQQEIQQIQQIKKQEKKQPANKLTFHVVTRFYRAPQLILLNPYYDSSIQMWSVGCILAQLIGFHKANKVIGTDYKPFFQGKACFPLSPPKKQLIDTYSNHNGFPHSEQDQISVILNVIGTPSQQDISFLTDKYALQFIKSFSKKPSKNMKSLFKYSKPEWSDFLQKTLVFNPKKRMSVDEALNHPIFANVRNQKLQNYFSKEITENLDLHSGLTIDEIRQKFIEEIKYHQNKVKNV